MIKISIIIPVYKVEKYIRGTLNSIYKQRCETSLFEVIIVNDGTPDNSITIVQEFKTQYNNLQIINQDNQGLSCARNAGLKIAKGEYIWFIDSDDTIESGSILKVLQYIQSDINTEIWGFNILRIQEKNREEQIEHIILNKKDFKLYNIPIQGKRTLYKSHIAPVQRFIFKHSFLIKNNLNFYPHIYHEDIEFMSKALFCATRVKIVNYSPYRYLVRESGSIMSSLNMKSITDKTLIINELNNFKQKYAITKYDKAYFDAISLFLIRSIFKYTQHNNSNYKNFIKLKQKDIRAVLINGLWASWYLKDIKKVIATIILLLKIK